MKLRAAASWSLCGLLQAQPACSAAAAVRLGDLLHSAGLVRHVGTIAPRDATHQRQRTKRMRPRSCSPKEGVNKLKCTDPGLGCSTEAFELRIWVPRGTIELRRGAAPRLAGCSTVMPYGSNCDFRMQLCGTMITNR